MRFRKAAKVIFSLCLACGLIVNVQADKGYPVFGFCEIGNKKYWYEEGVRQGTMGDPKNVIGDNSPRGREIYDPASDGWYWLDSIYDGAAAYGKEVWMPYIYQNEAMMDEDEMKMNASNSDPGMENFIYEYMMNGMGKWVRYDENGMMMKGWVKITGELAELYPDQAGNEYYYDTKTGLMAKGTLVIDGIRCHFDEVTGVYDNSGGIELPVIPF